MTTCADFLAKIDMLAPIVTQHRAALERDRRLPAPLFDAIADAGLLRLWLPKSLGGPELSPFDFMEVVEAVAALDGSVGWIVGNGGGMSRTGGYVHEDIARGWFADPRAFIVAATGAVGDAVRVPGGYRVTGRWPFGSGIHHATLAMGLCRLADGRADDAPPTLLCCHFPIADVAIIDNWYVSGLRGSGSCDFTVQDLFVPAAHCTAFPDIEPTQPGTLYRIPAFSIFSWTVTVVPLGIARGAMTAFATLAAHSTRFATTSALRDRETVQAEFGRAEASHTAARAFLIDAMTELMAATDQADGPNDERLTRARIRFRLSCAHAAEAASHIVERLAAAAGTASIRETGTLERCLRDVHAASRHIAMSPNNYILAGRVGLGLDPGTARF